MLDKVMEKKNCVIKTLTDSDGHNGLKTRGETHLGTIFGIFQLTMSYCREEGKDKIIFVTESDHSEPSKVELPEVEDEAEYEGLIKANGEINWECPCLGGMATGVCGEQFKAAFSCFHTSTSEPKGSDCIEQFRTMQECFRQYPEVYGEFESVDSDENEEELFDFVDEQTESSEQENAKSETWKDASSPKQKDNVEEKAEKIHPAKKDNL